MSEVIVPVPTPTVQIGCYSFTFSSCCYDLKKSQTDSRDTFSFVESQGAISFRSTICLTPDNTDLEEICEVIVKLY